MDDFDAGFIGCLLRVVAYPAAAVVLIACLNQLLEAEIAYTLPNVFASLLIVVIVD